MNIVYAGNGLVGNRCLNVLLHDFNIHPLLMGHLLGEGIDLLISVHWPYKFDQAELSKLTIGALNLHNSYLPWNRGAHACNWAIVDGTPHGATLHWVDKGIDTGDIFYQEQLTIFPDDTADSLYKRTADLEVEVFRHGMAFFLEGDRTRKPQVGRGSYHRKSDLEFLKRALTTNDMKVVNV